jgi:hypothetical protein
MSKPILHDTKARRALALACCLPPTALSASELARKLRVTRQCIRNWILGARKPQQKYRVALEGLLGIPVSYWEEPASPTRRMAA